MITNEKLFYNKFKYRIRFHLRKGVSLLRNSMQYPDTQSLLNELSKIQQFWRERELNTKFMFASSDQWNLNINEQEILIRIFHYREEFKQQDHKQIRVENPLIDFYTSHLDYVKKAEDTGLNPEVCTAYPDDPNVIVVKKLPYENFELKCITRYSIINRQVADSLLEYEDAGEIKFPWTWETRRLLIDSRRITLPEYIYAQSKDSLTFVSLIAGDIITTVYSYKII